MGQWERDYPKWVEDETPPFFVPGTSQAMMRWVGNVLQSPVPICLACSRMMVEQDFRDEMRKIAVPTVDKPLVDTSPNCGNILAGIGPFAIERGLVKAQEDSTTVRVKTLNTGTVAELVVSTPGCAVSYDGDARIDGVPGTSAPILVNFLAVRAVILSVRTALE